MHHLEASGDLGGAAGYARKAARLAERTLAFDSAAELYAAAMRLGGETRGHDLLLPMADALRAAGRGVEAASVYLRLAERSSAPTRWRLRQRAGEQQLISGHINAGISTLEGLLQRLEEPLPNTNAQALWMLMVERLALRRRGLAWVPRRLEDVPAEELHRLEVLRAIAFGLGVVDNLRGAIYSARALRRALDLGVPALVAEALGTQAVFEGSQSTASRVQGRQLCEFVWSISKRFPEPSTQAWAIAVEAILDGFDGVRDAPQRMAEASAIFESRTIGNTWNTNSLKVIHALTLRLRGDFDALRRLVDESLREASRQNNRYMECTIRHGGALLFLVEDDVAGARRSREAVQWDPTPRGMHIQHLLEMESSCLIALYEGRGAQAFKQHRSDIFRMFTSLVMRLQRVRVMGMWLCGTLAIATRTPAGRGLALVCASRLEAEGVPYAALYAALLRVSLAWARSDDVFVRVRTLTICADAIGSPFFRALSSLLRAKWRCDEQATHAATTKLQALGVVAPERLCALYVPSTLRQRDGLDASEHGRRSARSRGFRTLAPDHRRPPRR